jgi:hypothetical protein
VAAIMGGVFSRTYTGMGQLWGAFAFHAIAMILGMMCIAKSVQKAR